MSVVTPSFLLGGPRLGFPSTFCVSSASWKWIPRQVSTVSVKRSPCQRLCVRASANSRKPDGRSAAGVSARLSLMSALSSQVARQTEEGVRQTVLQAAKIVGSGREIQSIEEAFMTVPDLETIPTRVLARENGYEIREVESYLVAQTDMAAQSNAWDFFSSSQAFNTLAGYLFGKNSRREEMEMTTPVITRQEGEQMEMTTPVLNKQGSGGQWQMAFVIPSKYNESTLPLPQDSSVKFHRVPAQTLAVISFSGLVNNEVVKEKENALRMNLLKDPRVKVKTDSSPQIAQYNPPFTPPFMRRNEISIVIEWT